MEPPLPPAGREAYPAGSGSRILGRAEHFVFAAAQPTAPDLESNAGRGGPRKALQGDSPRRADIAAEPATGAQAGVHCIGGLALANRPGGADAGTGITALATVFRHFRRPGEHRPIGPRQPMGGRATSGISAGRCASTPRAAGRQPEKPAAVHPHTRQCVGGGKRPPPRNRGRVDEPNCSKAAGSKNGIDPMQHCFDPQRGAPGASMAIAAGKAQRPYAAKCIAEKRLLPQPMDTRHDARITERRGTLAGGKRAGGIREYTHHVRLGQGGRGAGGKESWRGSRRNQAPALVAMAENPSRADTATSSGRRLRARRRPEPLRSADGDGSASPLLLRSGELRPARLPGASSAHRGGWRSVPPGRHKKA